MFDAISGWVSRVIVKALFAAFGLDGSTVDDRKLRRQKLVIYISRSIDAEPAPLQSAGARQEYYELLLGQLRSKFRQLHEMLLCIFPHGRITPMKDVDQGKPHMSSNKALQDRRSTLFGTCLSARLVERPFCPGQGSSTCIRVDLEQHGVSTRRSYPRVGQRSGFEPEYPVGRFVFMAKNLTTSEARAERA